MSTATGGSFRPFHSIIADVIADQLYEIMRLADILGIANATVKNGREHEFYIGMKDARPYAKKTTDPQDPASTVVISWHQIEECIAEAVRRAKAEGIPVIASMWENGYYDTEKGGMGKHELVLGPESPLIAARHDIRLGEILQETAEKYGVAIDHRAKPHGLQAGCGNHIHTGFNGDVRGVGVNLFLGEEKGPSKLLFRFIENFTHIARSDYALTAPSLNASDRLLNPYPYAMHIGLDLVRKNAGFLIRGNEKDESGIDLRAEFRLPSSGFIIPEKESDCNDIGSDPYLMHLMSVIALRETLEHVVSLKPAGAEPTLHIDDKGVELPYTSFDWVVASELEDAYRNQDRAAVTRYLHPIPDMKKSFDRFVRESNLSKYLPPGVFYGLTAVLAHKLDAGISQETWLTESAVTEEKSVQKTVSEGEALVTSRHQPGVLPLVSA